MKTGDKLTWSNKLKYDTCLKNLQSESKKAAQ